MTLAWHALAPGQGPRWQVASQRCGQAGSREWQSLLQDSSGCSSAGPLRLACATANANTAMCNIACKQDMQVGKCYASQTSDLVKCAAGSGDCTAPAMASHLHILAAGWAVARVAGHQARVTAGPFALARQPTWRARRSSSIHSQVLHEMKIEAGTSSAYIDVAIFNMMMCRTPMEASISVSQQCSSRLAFPAITCSLTCRTCSG